MHLKVRAARALRSVDRASVLLARDRSTCAPLRPIWRLRRLPPRPRLRVARTTTRGRRHGRVVRSGRAIVTLAGSLASMPSDAPGQPSRGAAQAPTPTPRTRQIRRRRRGRRRAELDATAAGSAPPAKDAKPRDNPKPPRCRQPPQEAGRRRTRADRTRAVCTARRARARSLTDACVGGGRCEDDALDAANLPRHALCTRGAGIRLQVWLHGLHPSSWDSGAPRLPS